MVWFSASGRPGPSSSTAMRRRDRPSCCGIISMLIATRSPLARIVDEVPDHLLEILSFAPEADAGRRAHVDGQILVPVNLLEGAGESADDGLNLRDNAEGSGQRRRTRSVEVIVDLITHDGRLLADFRRKVLRRVIDFIDDDAQRRFKRVGEIAHLRAGPFQDFAIRVEKKVKLLSKRRNITWVGAWNALGFAPTDGRHCSSKFEKRL